MALNNLGLGFIFTAKDHASRTIDNISKSMTRMERAQTATQKVMQAGAAMMVASMAGLAAGKKLLDGAWFVAGASGLFEQRVQVLGVSAEATASELKQLRSAALAAGSSTQYNPLETVDTLKQLAQQGLSASQSLRALRGTLDFASAAELTGANAAGTLAAAINVFKLKADDAVMISDKLMKLTTSTAVEAHELQVMLGTVSRGAGITGQSLDEMLVSMGMVKNTGVDATVAASSVSTALLELVKNSDKLKSKLGVNIEDGAGKFRPFLDIVMDAQKALGKIKSPTKRVELIEDLSGRFGLTAFTAITTQLEKGLETTTGDIVKGAAAVDYLRGRIADATGTSQKFKNAFLDSLPGQVKILENSFSTLGIEVGKSFAEFTRPGVEKAIEIINWLREEFSKLPEPMKRMIAVATYVTSGVLILGSAILFAVGAFAVLAPAIPIAVAALKGLLAVAWPVVVVAGALALAFIAVKRAFDQNIGGFADRARAIFNKVKLAIQGIAQFIQHGFIRGSVAKELAKKENEGILGFVRSVVGYIFRIKKFFSGIGEGFMATVDAMGPAFDFLISSLENLGEYLGVYSKETADGIGRSEKWKKVGEAVGKVLGKVAITLVAVAGVVLWWFNLNVRVYTWVMSKVFNTVDGIVKAFDWLSTKYDELVAATKEAWGKIVLAYDVSVLAIKTAVNALVDWVSSSMTRMFEAVKSTATGVWDSVKQFFVDIKNDAQSAIDSVITRWENFANKITGIWDRVRNVYKSVTGTVTDFKEFMSEGPLASADALGMAGPKSIIPANTKEYLPTVGGATRAEERPAPAYAVNVGAPEVPQLAVPNQGAQKRGITAEEVQMAMQNALAAHSKSSQRRPEVATLILDGEKVGQVVRGGTRGRAANSFAEGEWGEG